MVSRVSWLFIGVMIIACFAGAGEGHADPLARPSMDDAKWRFDFTPYKFFYRHP